MNPRWFQVRGWSSGSVGAPNAVSLTSGEGRGLEIEFNHGANDPVTNAYVMNPQQNLWGCDEYMKVTNLDLVGEHVEGPCVPSEIKL